MIARTSLRTRLVLIVFTTAIVPLGLVGAWLVSSISRSGEELLRARLEDSVSRLAAGIGARWVVRRADLLTIAEHEAVQGLLVGGALERPPADFGGAAERLHSGVQSVTVRPIGDERSWPLLTADAAEPAFTASLDVVDRASGRRIGTLDARMRVASLVPSNAAWTAGAGAVLGLIDPATNSSLLPLPFETHLLTLDRFEWSGEQWITVRRRLNEPPIELVAAAPLMPFARPFEAATRQGFAALLVVATLAALVTIVLTRGTMQSLRRLADAAGTIAAGQYGATVPVRSEHDEVGRVARAFNSMSTSLRQTLDQLAQRQSLAAVGEFAATLAHEVRNPLTAIRIDLQRLEEKLAGDPALREQTARALRTVQRLDATVTGALRVARSGQATLTAIDVREPLRSAIQDAASEMRARSLDFDQNIPDEPHPIMGDSAALYQLFLNLLLNAAQATPAGGHVSVSLTRGAGDVVIRVHDSGPGISPTESEQVFAPFYSTKAEGTGLGLAIARRIATAHGGRLHVENCPPPGATLAVHLPAAANVTS